MRLIDADELKKALAKNITIWTFNVSYDGILAEIIDNAPTITPFASVEYETFREYDRPHGKWLNNRVAFHFTCDYCGCNIRQLKSEVFEGNYDYNFCPNCGAEMRGDKNG